MTEFLQLHLLTAYPPANLNRDDLGRPKTAEVGGRTRLRISSQSLKRAWRKSSIFNGALEGHVGTRTKKAGSELLEELRKTEMEESQAVEAAKKIAESLGAAKGEEGLTEQLVHLSPDELESIRALGKKLAEGKRQPTEEELHLFRNPEGAVDIALFGRMVAAKPEFNVEAAAQVAHAITVHEAAVEDDYFTAVDDLNVRGGEEEAETGAGHVGEAGFAAGLFYLYVCINTDLLAENLGGNRDLSRRTLRALVEAATRVSPTGKQASFASRAYASFALAERGGAQPRSLVSAFWKPVSSGDYLGEAITRLQEVVGRMDQVYGATADERYSFSVVEGSGTLAGLLDFVAPAGG